MSTQDPSRFERHHQQLLKTREQLTRRLRALERDARTPLNKDSEEQATELENRDVMIALGDEAHSELAEIERALERLRTGSYGTCVRCGEPIAEGRLDAYPAAARCVACASD